MSDEKWISVEDRLPEKYAQVLVALKSMGVYPYPRQALSWCKRGNWFGQFTDPLTGSVQSGEFPEGMVTHWMPLPAPPEVKP